MIYLIHLILVSQLSSSTDQSEISRGRGTPTQYEINEMCDTLRALRPRGTKAFIDERIVFALDKSSVSDRDAIDILAATAAALGHDLKTLILNRTTLRRIRIDTIKPFE